MSVASLFLPSHAHKRDGEQNQHQSKNDGLTWKHHWSARSDTPRCTLLFHTVFVFSPTDLTIWATLLFVSSNKWLKNSADRWPDSVPSSKKISTGSSNLYFTTELRAQSTAMEIKLGLSDYKFLFRVLSKEFGTVKWTDWLRCWKSRQLWNFCIPIRHLSSKSPSSRA